MPEESPRESDSRANVRLPRQPVPPSSEGSDGSPPSFEGAEGGGSEEVDGTPGSTTDRLPVEATVLAERVASARQALYFFMQLEENADRPRRRKVGRYTWTFELDETHINKFARRSRERLGELIPLADVGEDLIRFAGTVRYADLTTQDYDDIDLLLDRAGESRNIESIVLQWSSLVAEPPGSRAGINFMFSTEDKLTTQMLGPLEQNHPQVELSVQGPTDEWTETTFDLLNSYVDATEIGYPEKVLVVFRKLPTIIIGSILIASYGQQLASWLTYTRLSKSPTVVKEAILGAQTMELKFNKFIEYYFADRGATYFLLALIPLAVWGALTFAGWKFLPLLAPRSTISIGLAANRVRRYRNTFSFVVFTLMIFGIILPIIVNLIT